MTPVAFTRDNLRGSIPTYNELDTQAIADRYRPTTLEALAAFQGEVFKGTGSGYLDAKRLQIEAEDDSSPLTKEEWEVSPDYRQKIPYFEGMTVNDAKSLSEIYDEQERRAFTMSRASGAQKTLGIGAGFVTGLFEPKNLASGIAAAAVTSPLGGAASALGRGAVSAKRVLSTSNKVKRAFAFGAMEGAIGTAITEPSNRSTAKFFGQDYTYMDTLLNFATSTALSGVFSAGGEAWRAYKAGRRLEPPTQAEGLENLDIAIRQMETDQPVEVPVKEVLGSEIVPGTIEDVPTTVQKILDSARLSDAEKQQELDRIYPLLDSDLQTKVENVFPSLRRAETIPDSFQRKIENYLETPGVKMALSDAFDQQKPPTVENLKAETPVTLHAAIETGSTDGNVDIASLRQLQQDLELKNPAPERKEARAREDGSQDKMDLVSRLEEHVKQQDVLWNTIGHCVLRGMVDEV